MRLLLVTLLCCTLVAQIIASDEEHTDRNRGLSRLKRGEDEYEPDDRDIEEVKAALARKPKIARPAYSKLKKSKKPTTAAPTTTEAPAETEPPKVVEPEQPKEEARSLDADKPEGRLPDVLPANQEFSSVQKQPRGKALRLYSGNKGSVPIVVAPVPASELHVPLAPEERQVNSIQEKPLVVAPLPVAVAVPRGSRPRGRATSTKSKSNSYLEGYPSKADLSPAYQAKALTRAEVSEDPYEECPYGMRLSVCRLRAAQRLGN